MALVPSSQRRRRLATTNILWRRTPNPIPRTGEFRRPPSTSQSATAFWVTARRVDSAFENRLYSVCDPPAPIFHRQTDTRGEDV
jgi:hypothetical protein